MTDIKKTDLSTEQFLQSVLRELATSAAMGAAYAENWGTEYRAKDTDRIWHDADDHMRQRRHRRITIAELRDLTEVQLRALGFMPWDENMTAIPLWAWNYIADGERVHCIDGGDAIKGTDEIDLDVRMGCIAYGFKPTTL